MSDNIIYTLLVLAALGLIFAPSFALMRTMKWAALQARAAKQATYKVSQHEDKIKQLKTANLKDIETREAAVKDLELEKIAHATTTDELQVALARIDTLLHEQDNLLSANEELERELGIK